MVNLLVISWRDWKHEEAGGEEKFLYEILSRMGEEHDITYLCCGASYLDGNESYDDVRYHRVGNKYTFFLLVVFAYLRLGRRFDFDVVVENITAVPFYTPLYVRRPLVAIEHHITGRIFFEELPTPLAVLGWLSERLIPLVYADIPFITVSESSRRELEDMGLKVRAVVHNGVDDEILQDDVPEEVNRDMLLYLGRIKRHKQLEDVVRAFELVRQERPGTELHIAGTGDHLEELKRFVRDRGIKDSVTFHGYVNESKKRTLLNETTLFLTGTIKEGWGITVLEANAYGTPAVGYSVPGLRDSIRDGETGYLCNRNHAALARKVLELIKSDDTYSAMVRSARDWSEQFSWNDSTVEFENAILGSR